MTTSDRQIGANRRNALHSTGPKTEEGKRAVSQNALKHGILTREAVIDNAAFGECPEDLAKLLAQLCADRAPVGTLEDLLVQQLASVTGDSGASSVPMLSSLPGPSKISRSPQL